MKLTPPRAPLAWPPPPRSLCRNSVEPSQRLCWGPRGAGGPRGPGGRGGDGPPARCAGGRGGRGGRGPAGRGGGGAGRRAARAAGPRVRRGGREDAAKMPRRWPRRGAAGCSWGGRRPGRGLQGAGAGAGASPATLSSSAGAPAGTCASWPCGKRRGGGTGVGPCCWRGWSSWRARARGPSSSRCESILSAHPRRAGSMEARGSCSTRASPTTTAPGETRSI